MSDAPHKPPRRPSSTSGEHAATAIGQAAESATFGRLSAALRLLEAAFRDLLAEFTRTRRWLVVVALLLVAANVWSAIEAYLTRREVLAQSRRNGVLLEQSLRTQGAVATAVGARLEADATYDPDAEDRAAKAAVRAQEAARVVDPAPVGSGR